MKFFFVKMKQKCKKYTQYLVVSKKCCTFAQILHKDIFEGVNFFSIFLFFFSILLKRLLFLYNVTYIYRGPYFFVL